MDLIPSFSYNYRIDSYDKIQAMEEIKKRLASHGAGVVSHSIQLLEMEIPARNLFPSSRFIPDLLSVKIHNTLAQGVLRIEVSRRGEQRACVLGIVFLCAVAFIAFVFSNSPKTLTLPVVAYGFMWIYSYMPMHPAHDALRMIILESSGAKSPGAPQSVPTGK